MHSTLRLFLASWLLLSSSAAIAGNPECSDHDKMAANLALSILKNANLLDTSGIDLRTTQITLMASERIGKDLYHKVYLFEFTDKSGKQTKVIARSVDSQAECDVSMRRVDVFIVSQQPGR